MASISIVIRAYNEEEHISKLLSGIHAQNVDTEIILVDSGSTDATVPIASQFNVEIVNISPEEFSFGRALNKGCQAATGEFLVFASAHVYPLYEDWLQQLLKPIEDPKVALVYGKQRGNEQSNYSEQQLFKKWFPENSDFNQNHPFCNNANVAIRKNLWLSFPYDENLTGLEDLDWANRVMQSGYKIAYNAKAEIIHIHNETYSKILNRYRREAMALKTIMPQEHFNFWDFIRLFLGNSISDAVHALKEGCFKSKIIEIISFRFNQFLGTYKGYYERMEEKALRQRFYYPNSIIGTKTHTPEDGKLIDYSHLLLDKDGK